MHRLTTTALAAAALTLLPLVSPWVSPASAHAIIELDGTSAVAGKRSSMTLEIQHGCLPDVGTVQVQAFVGKPWRAVAPQPVDGWTTAVDRQAKGGWRITWTHAGDPIPFGTPVFFPITVAWPSSPGTYGMSVMQLCPDASYYWNDAYTPATAAASSPPLTPRPEVLVVAQSQASSTSTSTSTTSKPVHAH